MPCASASNATHEDKPEPSEPSLFWVGVCLSIVADVVVAGSLGIQKLAHNRNKGADGHPVEFFVKLPLWWLGMTLNIAGEIGNMLAYGMAPASIVAPVGSVGVVVNQLICLVFLQEPFRYKDIVGITGIIAGVILIIVAVPETKEVLTVETLLSDKYYMASRCCGYVIFVVVLIVVLTGYFEPRFALEWILVWILLCSVISSLTVMSCRGFSSLVTQVPRDCSEGFCGSPAHTPCSGTIGHWLFWILLVLIAVTAVWSAGYLNKAMMYYGNSQVVPIYYCTFTLSSIIGGAVIYNELGAMTLGHASMFGAGLLLALSSVMLLISGRPPEVRGSDSSLEDSAVKVEQGEPKAVSRKEGRASSKESMASTILMTTEKMIKPTYGYESEPESVIVARRQRASQVQQQRRSRRHSKTASCGEGSVGNSVDDRKELAQVSVEHGKPAYAFPEALSQDPSLQFLDELHLQEAGMPGSPESAIS